MRINPALENEKPEDETKETKEDAAPAAAEAKEAETPTAAPTEAKEPEAAAAPAEAKAPEAAAPAAAAPAAPASPSDPVAAAPVKVVAVPAPVESVEPAAAKEGAVAPVEGAAEASADQPLDATPTDLPDATEMPAVNVETPVTSSLPTDAKAQTPSLNDTSETLSPEATATPAPGVTVEPVTTTGQPVEQGEPTAPSVSGDTDAAPADEAKPSPTAEIPEAEQAAAGPAAETPKEVSETAEPPKETAEPAAPEVESTEEEKEEEKKASISLEEETLYLAQASQAEALSAIDLAESERLEEQADALEDLAVIASGIENATPAEIAMLENAGTLIVAGTDINSTQSIPSLESYLGGRIDTESIRRTARKLWEAVRRNLAEIWKKINQYLASMVATVPALRRRLSEVRERLHRAEGVYHATTGSGYNPASEKFEISVGASALSIVGIPVRNERELLAAVRNLAQAVHAVFGSYANEVAHRGQVIELVMQRFDSTDPKLALLELVRAMHKSRFTGLPVTPSRELSSADFAVSASVPLLNNSQLVMRSFLGEPNDVSVLGALDRCRRTGAELVTRGETRTDKRVEFQVLSLSSAYTLIDELDRMLADIVAYQRGAGHHIDDTRKRIEHASEVFTKRLESESGEMSPELLAQFRSLLNFNTAFARWARDPAVGLTSTANAVVRASMMLLNQSAAVYNKVPPAEVESAGKPRGKPQAKAVVRTVKP